MRDSTIARNYAAALLALGTKAENRDGFGAMIHEVATAVGNTPALRNFLASPRVSAAQKEAVLSKAYGDRVPRVFLRFLQKLVQNRRQMLIPEIASEYMNLLDEVTGRVHAEFTVAKPMDEAAVQTVASNLSAKLGTTVVPHVTVNPAILGGIVIKIGDTVMDGSVRRRLSRLARHVSAA